MLPRSAVPTFAATGAHLETSAGPHGMTRPFPPQQSPTKEWVVANDGQDALARRAVLQYKKERVCATYDIVRVYHPAASYHPAR